MFPGARDRMDSFGIAAAGFPPIVPHMRITTILWWLPAVAWAATIAYLSNQPPSDSPPIWFLANDKLDHAVAFGLLASLAMVAFRKGHRWALPRSAWGGVLAIALYGLIDEVHQAFTPGRIADPLDWLADVAGALAVTMLVLVWHRRRSVS
jgi:VanZ family protein